VFAPIIPDSGGNIYVNPTTNAPVYVPNILDDLITWDLVIHSVDGVWSLWKAIEMYFYGYFFWN